MKKKAIALIPVVARRKRKAKAKQGAKIGGPTIAAGAAATGLFVFLRRRKKRTAPDPAYTPQEAQKAAPAQTEAAAQDADQQTVEASTASGATGATTDALGNAPVAPGADIKSDEVVVPDTSADDPRVREETNAAAAEAGAIGGTPAPPPGDTEGMPNDPASRAAEEASGESYEGFEQAEEGLGSRRETGG